MKLPKNGLTDKITSVLNTEAKGNESSTKIAGDSLSDSQLTNSQEEANHTDAPTVTDKSTSDNDSLNSDNAHDDVIIGNQRNVMNKAPNSNVGINDTAQSLDADKAGKQVDDSITTSDNTEAFSVNQGLFANLFDKATKLSKSKLNRNKFDPTLVEGDVINNMQLTPETDMKDVKKLSQPLRLTFLGGGSFGTSMSNLAARNGCDSTLWVRNKRTVKSLQKSRMNKKYLPGFTLDENLSFDYDLKVAIKDRDIIFVAVPSSAFRETLKKIAPYITGQSIVSLTKGMEKDTFALMSDIIEEELPEVNFGVMSGPNFAVEIMKNMPSASVIASESSQLRHAVQLALHSAFFRVFAADDVRGVELGGALKNIYAIAMGMASYYNVGENTKAMILTRGLAEMSRFGAALGANPLTFLGLSGVGDLYATCSSEQSRNYRIGNMLGKGLSLEAAIKKVGQTAEGINTIQQVHEKATKLGIYMPITHALHAVIYEDQAALGVALHLMEAGFRSDVEFVMPHEHTNDDLNAQISSS